MSGPIPPKTLAKTLATIACTLPHEYGLFWDEDGTMPWKEFYWALQEDPRLRFVRESTLKELTLLGYPLPFALDGSRLRLRERSPETIYDPVGEPPPRLFTAIRRRHLPGVRAQGLRALHRSYVPLWTDPHTAERMAKRRNPDFVILEIRARDASASGTMFFLAGRDLYLTKFVDVRHVVFPKTPLEDDDEPSRRPSRVSRPEEQENIHAAPGSFPVAPRHIQKVFPNWASETEPAKGGSGKRGKKEGNWKREARKERRKREI